MAVAKYAERNADMATLEEKILNFSRNNGIDVLGFGNRERFKDCPARKNPFTIFPEGKTVIILGKRILRGSLRGIEEGTNFQDYSFFGLTWLEDEFLALACYELTRVIEDEGYEAVPVFPNPCDIPATGVSVAEGREAPNVFPDFDYAAVACGVAEIALNGLVFTPEFGPRQRFHMIITDAELPPTPILDQRVCDYCMKCVSACPLGAISTELEEVTVCGKAMDVAKINCNACKACKNGAVPNRFSASSKPDRVAALCSRTCICHLEEAGLVKNVFESKFRDGEYWEVDKEGKSRIAEGK
jgi:epoxyqueuosine reductase QueG